MTAEKTRESTVTEGHELVITRVFDAPRELLFALWTDPAHVVRWMGPRGFTVTHLEQDPRPGGAWRLCLSQDDGSRHLWRGGINKEIVEPERLVFTFAWEDADGRPGHETLVTVTFAEQDGKTKMTFRQAFFETVEQRDGHHKGWSSSFDRLEEYAREVRDGGGQRSPS